RRQGTGSYQRNITAIRFQFGSQTEGSILGLSFLKSKDDSTSIKNGYSPKENFVAGLDQSFATNQNRFKGQVGAAISIVTNNISGGAVTKEEFENRLKTELVADPYKYRKIQTINYSTVIPGKSTFSGYLNFQFKRKINVFTIDYKYFGAGYQSFGNPFVRTDIQTASIQDQLYLWKRRIMFNVKYTFQNNNISKTAFTTVNQHFVNGSLNFVYSAKAPQFIVNYNLQTRRSADIIYKTLGANDQNNTLNALMIYTIKTGKISHSFNLNYTTINRIDKVYISNNNNMNIYSVGLREQLTPINTTIDFQYSKSNLKDINGFTPINQSFDTRVRYQNKKYKYGIGLGYTRSEMLLTRFGSSKSMRNSFSLVFNAQLSKQFKWDIEAGDSPYRSSVSNSANYDELYIYSRLTWMIGTFLRK
ncbi:MAG: hypothetical protein HYZ42_16110, partial [Bacteroidetes bacterium]|nr:hypothetical protein [Bacteroidota bacterium]